VKVITAAEKNALYGALAIVTTDVPQIVGASGASVGIASASTTQPS
jgi:hypothetical protein